MFFLRVCNATRYNTVLFNMSDAEDSNVRSRPNPEVVDPSIGAAIQVAVTRSIGSLTDNLTQVTESRLTILPSVFQRKTVRPLSKLLTRRVASNTRARERVTSSS